VRVLIEPFIMGFGGRRGGEESSRPDEGGSKGKKAQLSADDIHRIVAQHRKHVMNNPNWKKIPRLLDQFTKEQLKALSFIKELKYWTDPGLIALYKEAEVERRKWFDKNSEWVFEENVHSDKLEVLSYMSAVDIYAETTELHKKPEDFIKMMGTPEGVQTLVAYDEMICVLLSKIFTQTSSLSMLKGFNDVKMVVGDSTTVLQDVINYVTLVVEVHSKVEHRISNEEVKQVIESLNENLKRVCPNLAVYMELMSNDKDLKMEEWISIMVDRAEEKAKSTDVFSDWEAKSKGADKGLSEAQLKELGDLRKENAQLKKENTQLKKHHKPSDPSTSAAPFSRTACHKCGLEGHKKDSCPNKTAPPPTPPAKPTPAPAKTSRKVNFTQLKEELEQELVQKVEQSTSRAVERIVSEMEKRGFSKKT
jgi:hypothetical protein